MSVPVGLAGQVTDVFLTVQVDEGKCTACGRCERACAEVFEVSRGKAAVRVTRVPWQLEDSCFDALEDCPQGAISVFEVRDAFLGLPAT
jgi:ferredoxin